MFSPCAKDYYHEYWIEKANGKGYDIRIKKNQALVLDCGQENKYLRKSYKSIINKAKKELIWAVLTKKEINREDFDLYVSLHIKNNSKYPRGKKTYDLMYDIIKKEEGFLVNVFSDAHHVGSYLFFGYNNNFYYASACTSNMAEKTGANHLALKLAIEHISKTGGILDLNDIDNSSPKKSAITFFKSGFCKNIEEVERGVYDIRNS